MRSHVPPPPGPRYRASARRLPPIPAIPAPSPRAMPVHAPPPQSPPQRRSPAPTPVLAAPLHARVASSSLRSAPAPPPPPHAHTHLTPRRHPQPLHRHHGLGVELVARGRGRCRRRRRMRQAGRGRRRRKLLEMAARAVVVRPLVRAGKREAEQGERVLLLRTAHGSLPARTRRSAPRGGKSGRTRSRRRGC
ncbi:hypothetical protein Zm00014a_033450 [Zea mays]|uniref:Uncharacterized protein n=2 Tax=Zea mays TaxID=4577 RepID=A0A3L6D8Q6_MAIZE|nr:hypothetical protein Zm00014a_044323 [Zea mays]PWZ57984.1 hypothetical protein Zm00014a_033450 [Zea mays]